MTTKAHLRRSAGPIRGLGIFWFGMIGLVGEGGAEEEWPEKFSEALVPVVESLDPALGDAAQGWQPWRTTTTPSKDVILGTFRSGEKLSLKREKLPAHRAVVVKLELVILSHWDGIWEAYGPDRWFASLDGGPVLLETTFSNFSPQPQNFPDGVDGLQFAARAASTSVGDLGWVNKMPDGFVWKNLDTTYEIWMAASHEADEFGLSFEGNFQDDRDPPESRGECWAVRGCQVWLVPPSAVPVGPWLRKAAESVCQGEQAPDPAAGAMLVAAGDSALAILDQVLSERQLDSLRAIGRKPGATLESVLEGLSDDDYANREAASAALRQIVFSEYEGIRKAFKEAKEPEVRMRLQAVLRYHRKIADQMLSGEQGLPDKHQAIARRLRKILTLIGSEEARAWLKALDKAP